MRVSCDFETYSDINLGDAGLYRYMESPNFEILLLAYAIDDDEPTVLDFKSMTAAEVDGWKRQFMEWMNNPDVRFSAYNAEFEINVFSTWFGYQITLDRWWDTMITALTCGLPRSLKDVGAALGMPEEKAKLAEGKRLVKYFCEPCKPSKANGMRTRNTRETDPEKWEKFVEYNRQDVVAEREIWYKVRKYEPNEAEHRAWMMSTEINRRGVMIDRKMAETAVRVSEEHTALLMSGLRQITGLENPNSNSQLASWLGVGSVAKASVEEELKTATGDRKRVLELRQEIGKTSIAKYEAMLNSVCNDGRIRGLFAFYGANRTGRFSSKIVQLQNLPQNHIEDLDTARQCLLDGDRDTLELLYENVPDTLSQLIRTTFIAKPGYTFAVADFSAIEARVVAYLTNEKWRQKLFAEGGDIYCQSASQMFGVPVVKHGINSHLRQKGKIAELACGYGGSVGAMVNMGALKMGLSEEELPDIVQKWRDASPNVVTKWWEIDKKVKNCIIDDIPASLGKGMECFMSKAMLHIKLPSGRCIRYYRPQVIKGDYGRTNIRFEAYDAGKWLTAYSYGPKIFENICQAVARDCLIVAMERVTRRYPDIVMHVHDEMIVEVPENEADEALQYMCDCMAEPIPWAPGLLLRGDGYTTRYYRKD